MSNPDFDIDFCYEGRGKVIEYVNEKYGKDKVAQIITFGTLAAKAAIKDVARVYKVPYAEVDKITKAIPDATGKVTISAIMGRDPKALKHRSGEIIAMYENDETVKKIIDMAAKIEGMPRNSGKHAAGVVICCDDISEHIPLQMSENARTTQFPKDQVEELGLLKMDFLGLKTLTVIEDTPDAREEIADYKAAGNQVMYIQKMVSHAGGHLDLGVSFLGGKYLATYARQGSGASWDTTTRTGGRYVPHEPSQEIIALAHKAQALFPDMAFTCVDVVETPEGAAIYEVSAFGGFRGLLDACGIDAASAYADYVLEKI